VSNEPGYQLIEPAALVVPAPANHAAYRAVLRWLVARLQFELAEELEGVRLVVLTAEYQGSYPVIAAQYLRDLPDISTLVAAKVDAWVTGTELGAFLRFLCEETAQRRTSPEGK
jgi:hypothetical protein